MRLRKPWMIKLAAWFGVGLLRCWMRTIACHTDAQGQATDPWDRTVRGNFIYAMWHDSLVFSFRKRSVRPVTALISQSSDGTLISSICHALNIGTVRGSSSRGGIAAARGAIEAARQSHLVVFPDGPRGPRRQVKPGIVHLASWTGLPIVPFGIGFERAWQARNWDRMSLPKPGSAITCVSGPIIKVPTGIEKTAVESYRRLIEETMLSASSAAQQWAETGERLTADSAQVRNRAA